MKHKLAVLLSIALCVASALAQSSEATPRRYAVISLISDSLDIVTYQPSTGSHLDQNLHQVVPLARADIDSSTLLAVQEEIKKADPTASVILLGISANKTQTGDPSFLHDQKYSPSEELSAVLKKEAATHLLLVTKYRADANLRMAHGGTGSGILEGLGYYIDRQRHMKRSDTLESSTGFLAPYAYFEVSCVDLATSAVLKRHAVTETTTLASGRSKEGIDPWDVLTPERKITMLRTFVHRGLAKAVPDVIPR